MAAILPFPCRDWPIVAYNGPECARFRPEVRTALIAMGYALLHVNVQFCAVDEDYEWAVVRPVSHAIAWFTINPVVHSRSKHVEQSVSDVSATGMVPAANGLGIEWAGTAAAF